MANFKSKTIKEIHDDFIARYTALRNKYGDTVTPLEKGVVNSIAWALGGVASTLWLFGLWIYQQSFPQTCDIEPLKLWGNLIDENYKYGEKASLTIQLTGATATYLSAQTVFYHSSGLVYKTISQAQNLNGTITATAQCVTAGPAGNLENGAELSLANPLAGIPNTATVTNILIYGTENEDKEDYRERVLRKYQRKSQGGSALDYYNWAMEVPGIVDVLPYTLSEGLVTLYIVAEGSGTSRNATGSITPNPFPVWSDGVFQDFTGSGQKLAIANSIEGSEIGLHDRRPMTAKVQISNCTYTAYSVEITGLTNTAYNTQIKNALIAEFDKKRPNIKVLNYDVANAKINSLDLISVVDSVIGTATFTGFVLKNSSSTTITEETLGVGCLAYMSSLTINGTQIEL